MFVKDIRFSRAVSACADRRRWTIAYWVENTCLLAKARVMLNGYQFRLYPNAEQQQILLRWFGCQRLIYNAKVQEDRYYRRFQRRMIGPVGKASPVDQKYSRFISERTDFLRKVPSQLLRNVSPGISAVFQKAWRSPKLKKKSGRQAVRITQELFEFRPQIDDQTGEIRSDQFTLGTE